MLVLLASIIALTMSVGTAVIFSYVVSTGSISSRQTVFTDLGIVTSVVSVVPYVLLFMAALGGSSEQATFPVQVTPPFANRS
jgi:flagellar biosynthesis component FlhA